MSQNDPGKSPWERKSNNPPSVEDFLEALQKKFKFNPNFNPFNAWILVAIGLVVWALTGAFIVQPQEQAAVKQFGKLVRVVGPGINYHLPYPIETVQVEKVTEVKRMEIGFRTINPGPPAQYSEINQESLMLTGDESIVDVWFVVQYVISDLGAYLFNTRDVRTTLRSSAESSMREVIGRNNIDFVLTERKAEIEAATLELLSGIMRSYNSGLTVQNVKLQDVQPPESVKDAFKEVASAREKRAQLINEAEGYRNDLLPRAQGEAEQIINQALSYQAEKLNQARGDTARFLSLLAEYDKAPQVTRKRLQLETMEEVFSNTNKVMVDPNIPQGILPVLPMGGAKLPRPAAAE